MFQDYAARTSAVVVSFVPVLVYATAPTAIVPACEGSGCGWTQLMQLARNIVDFLLYGLALPLAAVAFAYAGFQLMIHGGSDTARQNAKDAFLWAAIGLVVAFGAWVIVKFVMTVLFEEPFRSVG